MDMDSMRLIAQVAAQAPSVHNTQPWRFTVDDQAIEVWADRSRQLAALDPTGRQLAISCGAAIEFAALGVRSMGWRCEVELLPDLVRGDLLARLTPTLAQSASPNDAALVDAMSRRHTDRGPYGDRRPAAEVVDALRTGVERHGVWLRLIDAPSDRVVVMTALQTAEDRELADPAYVDELQSWVNETVRDDTLAQARPPGDGIPQTALVEWEADRVSDVPLRDFSGRDHRHRPGGDGPPPTVERASLLVIGTAVDGMDPWLRTGRALGWMLLRATVAGLSCQPLLQALDDPSIRIRLGRDLRLVGTPQFMLRIGYGHHGASTPRRPAAAALAG